MFIISGSKGTGKTKALIEKTKAEDGILLCDDPVKIRERAYGYGITGLNTMSYDKFFDDDIRVEYEGIPFYIHDINKFIKCFDSSIEGYTLNID